jgi:Protein of unknown function (DUF2493).
MNILVCGGRNYADYAKVVACLDAISGVTMVIQGGAHGADALAKRWASERNIHCAEVPAIWRPHGVLDRTAGPKRNRAMLLLRPDAVVAFPGGSGTADMIAASREAGLRVWVVN